MYFWPTRGGHRANLNERTTSEMAENPFNIDAFLARPLTARVATNGPTVRPTWFLWEDRAFWILTGPWAQLASLIRANPEVALVVDECDIDTGTVKQVVARGRADIVPFDIPRGRRKLTRYLGSNEEKWDQRFRDYLYGDLAEKGTIWLRIAPIQLSAKDLSYTT